MNQPLPILDMHTHLAGLGQGGTGCFISPEKFNSLMFKFLRYKLEIYKADKEGRLDEAYLQRLLQDALAARDAKLLAGAVIFAHDKIYLENGEVSERGQEVHVPNAYAFECSRKSNGIFLPAASVHPYRKDALEETAKWIEAGAAALKWLPNSQGMDPRNPKCAPIFRLLAEKKVPLIAHTGGEHTVRISREKLGDPKTLLSALDAGVTVIMAHCGTKSGLFDPNWMEDFFMLARKYPNCYGDNSAFTTQGRSRWMARFLKEEGIVEKLVHGSDYPVPPMPFFSLGRIGLRKAYAFSKTWSFLERDVRIKRAVGFPDVVFENAARILTPGCLEKWGIGATQKVGA